MQSARIFGIFIVTLLFLLGPAGQQSAGAAEPGRVEIVIRNSVFEVQGGAVQSGVPAVIVIKNVDRMAHGFVSLVLQEVDLRVESGGSATFGRGIKGVQVAPEGEVQIRFIPSRAGKFNFICDLHPNMKGEIAMLSVAGG
jgi:plastocyanin